MESIGPGDLTMLMWVRYIRDAGQNLAIVNRANGTRYFDIWIQPSYRMEIVLNDSISYFNDIPLTRKGEWT